MNDGTALSVQASDSALRGVNLSPRAPRLGKLRRLSINKCSIDDARAHQRNAPALRPKTPITAENTHGHHHVIAAVGDLCDPSPIHRPTRTPLACHPPFRQI